MDDNKPGTESGEPVADAGDPAAPERRKRPAPTIDLEASAVSDMSPAADAADQDPSAKAAESSGADARDDGAPARSWTLPIGVSALAGALAAALVVAALWATSPLMPNDDDVAGRGEAVALAALGARVAKIETSVAEGNSSQPAAADSALADRLTAAETALASLRDDVAALRAQAEKTVADIDAVKAARSETPAAPKLDTSAIEERLARIERATAELAATPPPQKAAPDPALKHAAAASALDRAVRSGAPFTASLAAVKDFADADALTPLGPFAASGVPDAAALSRELLGLLPRLEPKEAEAPASTGILDRLQHSAMKLVRIRRVDDAGADVAAVAARAKAAAQRSDVENARRELSSLPASERAPVQSWLDKIAARDAALAASQTIVTNTMAALPASAGSASSR